MLGDRPLALDSLRALRSSDVTEAALVAARNLPGRIEADDDRQEKLESPDELHGSGGMSTSNHYRRLISINDSRAVSLDTCADAWVFPSEKLITPLARDNCWRRSFLPKLKPVGLAWANFQVMRRTRGSPVKGAAGRSACAR